MMAAEGLLLIANGDHPDSIPPLFEAMVGEPYGKNLKLSLLDLEQKIKDEDYQRICDDEQKGQKSDLFLKDNNKDSSEDDIPLENTPASVQELKDRLSYELSKNIEKILTEHELLRNLIVLVCEKNQDTETRLLLGEYGLKEDSINLKILFLLLIILLKKLIEKSF